MFSGKEPFEGLSQVQVITKTAVRNERPSPMPNVPKKLQQLIESCWKQSPDQRPDIQKVSDALPEIQLEILLKQSPKPEAATGELTE